MQGKHMITLIIDFLLLAFFIYLTNSYGFAWPLIELAVAAVVAVNLSFSRVKGIEIEEEQKWIKILRFLGTIALFWALVEKSWWIGIALFIIAALIQMPTLIFRVTFYTTAFFIGLITIENMGDGGFAEFSEFFFYTVFEQAVNVWQVLAIGLALSFVLIIVRNETLHHSYSELLGIVTILVTPIYMLVFAVIHGVYNGVFSQVKIGLRNVQVKYVLRDVSYEHYLANEGPRQLQHIVRASKNQMKQEYGQIVDYIRFNFSKGNPIIFSIYALFYNVVKILSTHIVRVMIILTAGCIHIVILYTAKAIYQVTLSIVRGKEASFRKKHGVKMLCGNCYEQHELPLYSCPVCERKHELVPNHFGIFHHRCACGAKLPNRYAHDRQLLQASCRSCEAPYTELEISPIVVPVIGPSQVGKTKFTLNGLLALKETALSPNYTPAFVQQEKLQEIQDIVQQTPLVPTPITSRAPYVLHLQKDNKKPNQALCYYDLSGRLYEDYDLMKSLHFLSYADGFLFIIDIKKITSSDKVAIEDTLDRLLMYCQQEISNKVEDKVTIPIAFVLNKADHKNLKMMNHEAIMQWLTEKDVSHFVRKIDMSFTNYRFFLSSSNETQGEQAAIHAHQWLLEQTRKGLAIGGAQHVEK